MPLIGEWEVVGSLVGRMVGEPWVRAERRLFECHCFLGESLGVCVRARVFFRRALVEDVWETAEERMVIKHEGESEINAHGWYCCLYDQAIFAESILERQGESEGRNLIYKLAKRRKKYARRIYASKRAHFGCFTSP